MPSVHTVYVSRRGASDADTDTAGRRRRQLGAIMLVKQKGDRRQRPPRAFPRGPTPLRLADPSVDDPQATRRKSAWSSSKVCLP